ncbi:unnamed protein product [Callosobruchus maculatus]|uniref:Chitin-binding type-2 domain-containing protein n=1 Tax=Callosobruchus maculatus TaxID=64391 RepID=A0A653DJD6_CALMS|nr:unnamed protein product [Callosobruchus maculatus]
MKWVLSLMILSILIVKHSPEAFVLLPCSEKGFVCLGQYQFYQCILGDNQLYPADIKNCPKGMVCSDEDNLECDREQ